MDNDPRVTQALIDENHGASYLRIHRIAERAFDALTAKALAPTPVCQAKNRALGICRRPADHDGNHKWLSLQ